jgi:hypothetical protein
MQRAAGQITETLEEIAKAVLRITGPKTNGRPIGRPLFLGIGVHFYIR